MQVLAISDGGGGVSQLYTGAMDRAFTFKNSGSSPQKNTKKGKHHKQARTKQTAKAARPSRDHGNEHQDQALKLKTEPLKYNTDLHVKERRANIGGHSRQTSAQRQDMHVSNVQYESDGDDFSENPSPPGKTNMMKGLKMTNNRKVMLESQGPHYRAGQPTSTKTADRKGRAGSKHQYVRTSTYHQATGNETSPGRQHSTVSWMSSGGVHHGLAREN
jgi:hypothetical protein